MRFQLLHFVITQSEKTASVSVPRKRRGGLPEDRASSRPDRDHFSSEFSSWGDPQHRDNGRIKGVARGVNSPAPHPADNLGPEQFTLAVEGKHPHPDHNRRPK